MPGVLARVAAEFGRLAADGAERLAAECTDVADNIALAADNADHAEGDAALIERIFSSFDERFGGFGIEPKFPHTAPLHLAMALFRDTEDPRWRRLSFGRWMRWRTGRCGTRSGGGFFRYATARDWQLPHREKLLETNAAILRVCAEAAIVFGRDVDRERCANDRALHHHDPPRRDWRLRRQRRRYGALHRRQCVGVGALLAAATVLGDDELGREALASFERVLLSCYRPGAGLAHYYDGAAHVRGLLVDHVAAIGALLDAHDASDSEPYRMMAEELSHVIIRDLWDAESGGFFDRAPAPDDVGLLRLRRKPLVTPKRPLRSIGRDFASTRSARSASPAGSSTGRVRPRHCTRWHAVN